MHRDAIIDIVPYAVDGLLFHHAHRDIRVLAVDQKVLNLRQNLARVPRASQAHLGKFSTRN